MLFGASTRRLLKEFKELQKPNFSKQNGFSIGIVNDDITKWHIKLFNFDGTLEQDLQKTENGHVLLEVTFPRDYPSAPPFIRVVYPRFKFRTGHVTVGGSICMELLTNSGSERGWKSSITMEAIVLTIRQLMIDGGGRVIPGSPYTEGEAKSAFNRVATQHGWIRGSPIYSSTARRNIYVKRIFALMTSFIIILVLWNYFF